MKPIRDIASIPVSTVVYHSAFGFARVTEVSGNRVALGWEAPGDHLPPRVGFEVLSRVYAATEPRGFFHRALNDLEATSEWLQTDPTGALALLLAELPGSQRPEDIQD
nr:hypothetical protein [Deltaproteobacteria bacterium]